MDAAQIEQLVRNAVEAALRAVNPPPAAPAAPVFSLTPATLTNNQLDYSTAKDIKIYKAATDPMSTKFDCDPMNTQVFMATLTLHADTSNWSNIMTVPDSDGTDHNILKEHGQVTMDDCRAHAFTYVFLQDRLAQNNQMMFTYLTNS